MMKLFRIINSTLINSLLLIACTSASLYILLIVGFNVNKGFDITDESFYILSAQYPEDITATVTSFGFYTGILYYLSGENLSLFRLFGLFILVTTSFFFSKELHRYVSDHTKTTTSTINFILFVLPVTLASMAYYRTWLITPSYNWLNLVAIILFSMGLLRHINLYGTQRRYYFDASNILVALGGTLTFFAKPSSAIILFILAIFWSLVHCKKIRWTHFIIATLTLVLLFLNFHIVIFEVSYSDYYDKIINGMADAKLLGGGHTLDLVLKKTLLMLQLGAFKYYYLFKDKLSINNIIVFILYTIMISFLIKYTRFKYLNLVVSLLFSIFVFYSSYELYKHVLKIDIQTHLWFTVFLLLLIISIFISIMSICTVTKISKLKKIDKTVFLIIFLNTLSFAYAFGSNGTIPYIMGDAVLFTVASLVFLAYLTDSNLKHKSFLISVNIIVIYYIGVVINISYVHPYRLINNIDKQSNQIALSINSKSSLFVDEKTKRYINNMKSIAMSNGWKSGNYLIDMTGGTPGANVILDAKFIEKPWLLGAYPGSNKFALTALLSAKKEVLQDAWILVAPKGKRQLSLSILKKLGLNFPDDYKMLGKVTTAHRNEIQELWSKNR